MRHTIKIASLSIILFIPLLSTLGSTQVRAAGNSNTLDVASSRNCQPPSDAKEAQVIAFDRNKLEIKFAVATGKNEFKIVTVKVWERPEDPRPLVPVIEAARITQGKVQFYTPNLNADPEPVHDKEFLIAATLGGAQVCWATEAALLKDGGSTRSATSSAPATVTTSSFSGSEPRRR